MKQTLLLVLAICVFGCTGEPLQPDMSETSEAQSDRPTNRHGDFVKDGECGDKPYYSFRYKGTLSPIGDGTCVLITSRRYGG